MKRKYSTKQFKNIVEAFRASFPKITISTDIICGFPGETKIQFKESIDFITEVIKPDLLQVSKFRVRPGTDAASMEPVFNAEINERSKTASSLFEWVAFKNSKQWVGWSGDIIIDEIGTDGTSVGRNYAYKPIIINEKLKMGDVVKVKIVNSTKYELRGVKL